MSQLVAWCQQQGIRGLSIDSRHINPGDCFVAYCASHCDRRDFIEQALSHGAAAIIYEAKGADPALNTLPVPSLAVTHLYDQLALVAQGVYGNASQALTTIGVTGTNGKSSCVYYLAQALNLLQQTTALIGTFGNGFIDQLSLGENTTPGVIDLYRLLTGLKGQGAEAVAMEVSSHALAEKRVAGIHFDTAVFTGLSRDHLDFHGSMQAYAQAKQQLFEWPDLHHAVFNIDDEYGCAWAEQYADQLTVIATSMQTEYQWSGDLVQLVSAHIDQAQTYFVVKTPWGELQTHTTLLGRFNLANLLSVVAVLGLHGVTIEQMVELIPQLKPAPGRMEVYGAADHVLVAVDYAHTPDALEKALQALRPYCQGRLWCVFGCGGDRDSGKRPQMAAIAEQWADQVIVTDDNPRSEQATAIVADILKGFEQPKSVQVIADREQAIAAACQQAQSGDVVLVAGKGHEPYQIIGNKKLAFDDRQVVQQYIKAST